MIRIALALTTSILLAESAAAIVGGAPPVTDDLARHVVAVIGGNGSVCTGTAIARDLVLTAAHCVRSGAKYEAIELGGAGRPQRTNVASVEQHPQFDFEAANASRATADLAVLKLAKPLSPRVMPAALSARDFFLAGDRFTVAGFGSVGGLGDGTFGRLLAADLVAQGRQFELQLRLADPMTRGESPGSSACSGDSGGPVFEDTSTGLVLVGVVSWAASASGTVGCGGVTGATPIAVVRPWITETAKKLRSPLAPWIERNIGGLRGLPGD